jgi:hypothetical protein
MWGERRHRASRADAGFARADQATFDDRGGLTVRAVEEPDWH